ncbi:hypothetical protein EVB87_032 [Rhizobium phage RHph_N28_1]|nr:hypothetical protein EVB87_032 [Rhizobium phage RHph_N28_1]QIG74060.1 hypothetical protein EVC07_032 [Rhizobium phage RHph_N42]
MGKHVNVNVEHINEVIALIRDEANFFMLSTYDVPNDIARMEIDNKVEHLVTSPKSYAAKQVRKYNPTCNTPACIAGWSNYAFKRAQPDLKISLTSGGSAAEYLGIRSQAIADRLFGISIYSAERDRVTREEAIYALERLRDTGNVPSYRSIRQTLKRRNENASQLHGSQSSGQDRAQDRDDG